MTTTVPTAVWGPANAWPNPGSWPSATPPTLTAAPPPGSPFTPEVPTAKGAAASLIMGVLALATFWGGIVMGPLALVFGYQAKRRLAQDPGLQGAGMAKAGRVLGWVWCGVFVVGLAALATVAALDHNELGSGSLGRKKQDLAAGEGYYYGFRTKTPSATVVYQVRSGTSVDVQLRQSADANHPTQGLGEVRRHQTGVAVDGELVLPQGDWVLVVSCPPGGDCPGIEFEVAARPA